MKKTHDKTIVIEKSDSFVEKVSRRRVLFAPKLKEKEEKEEILNLRRLKVETPNIQQ